MRRDLRLTDNTALFNALHDAETILPVYVLDPTLLNAERNKGPRIAWMLDGLRILDRDLQALGGRLIVRSGKPEAELITLAAEVGAQAVYFNRDYSPYATARDKRVRDALQAARIAVYDFKDLVIHEAREVLTGAQQTFSVYSPYRKVWNTLPKPQIEDVEPTAAQMIVPAHIASLPIPDAAEFGAEAAQQPIAEPGEHIAQTRLTAFMADPVYRYGAVRDMPGEPGTSVMSPYLRWGMISARQCFDAAQHALASAPNAAARESVERWIGELVWREFYYQVLDTNPHVARGAYRPMYDNLAWAGTADQVEAWKIGQTGYPIVDAAMRQMNCTGWMHNRCRMIVASFLCKDLLVDWRVGERYFMQRLLDGDLANNNGGWQWTAGTGTDAAPYFRVFNPTTQGKKFDPAGVYLKRWLPELRRVPDEFLHEPHTMPTAFQESTGCVIGRDYPAPMVDHSVQRDQALALYARVRN